MKRQIILNNIKFKTLLRQSIMKSKESKNINPINEKRKEILKFIQDKWINILQLKLINQMIIMLLYFIEDLI